MAVINDPNTAANIATVGSGAYMPVHTFPGSIPIGSAGGAFALSMQSGTMAAALAGNAEIFQFRYVSASRVAVIHSVSISAGLNVAATAASLNAFRMTIARSWSAAGSGGTRATLTGNLQKLRTSYPNTTEVNDAGISSTGALTVGTKTLDTQDIGSVAFSVLTGAITVQVPGTLVPRTNLYRWQPGFPQLVLGNQEGFVVRMGANAMGATATWSFGVDVVWSELAAY